MVIDLAAIVQAILLALLGYLGHSFTSRIQADIKELKKQIIEDGKVQAELSGNFKLLHIDMQRYSEMLRDTTKELQAVWRYIDNAPKRASDIKIFKGDKNE